MKYGIVIGRFQTPELHIGHRTLLNTVKALCDKLVIFVGQSPEPLTKNNPLDFDTRLQMLYRLYPEATIMPIMDAETPIKWSNLLDYYISLVAPGDVTIYGGRDNCLKLYSGKHKTQTINLDNKDIVDVKASAIRSNIKPVDSDLFRSGIIYAANKLKPRLLPTVDIGIIVKDKLILGKKYGSDMWRLPGGTVETWDKCLQSAASRELREETNIYISDLEHVGSYINKSTKFLESFICSTLYTKKLTTLPTVAKAGDDLETLMQVEFPLKDKAIYNTIVPNHLPLIFLLNGYYEAN